MYPPKKLIFLFDGTSNEIDLDDPTNVLLLASGIANETRNKDKNKRQKQIIFYKKGVGTKESDRSGGLDISDKVRAFFEEQVGMISGEGVYNNILQAYEDLCFNYEPGDEIYVFGFSRGAYTARSFCGFIHHNAISKRVKIETTLIADKRYREKGGSGFYQGETKRDRLTRLIEDTTGECCLPSEQESLAKFTGKSPEDFPLINIKFLGVWDTVKTITSGSDDHIHEFHVDHLEPIIQASRHAIAIDEARLEFDVTPIQNIEERNKVAFYKLPEESRSSLNSYLNSDSRPHQERWFPGGHGSVGGGGNVRGLSDEAFLWVLEGAKEAGLSVDLDQDSKLFELNPNHYVSLDNTTEDGLLEKTWNQKAKFDKHVRIGPRAFSDISFSAIHRYAASRIAPDRVADGKYDPECLKPFAEELSSICETFSKDDVERSLMLNPDRKEQDEYYVAGEKLYVHKVLPGQHLGKLSKVMMGSTEFRSEIVRLNKLDITNPERIQVGQLLNLPYDKLISK